MRLPSTLSFSRPAIFSRYPWLTYALSGLIIYLLFLVATAPSSWVAWALFKQTGGSTTINQPSGSLWSGSGTLVININKGAPTNIGTINWSLKPFSAVTGKLGVGLSTSSAALKSQADLFFSPNSVRVVNGKINAQANVVPSFYSAAALFSPEGDLVVNLNNVRLGKKEMRGTVEIFWNNAASSLISVKPVGDYRLIVIGNGSKATVQLVTIKGDLDLNAQGSWDIGGGGRLNLNGTATPGNNAAALEPALKLFGKDIGNGKRILRLNQTVPFPL